MAYNTLRGTVNFSSSPTGSIESMVDDYSNQTIGGSKVFSSTLSASAVTINAGSLVPPAITSISNDGANRILVSDGDGTATADAGFTFNGTRMSTTTELTASVFSGSGAGLTSVSLEPHKVSGQLSASNIYIGDGLGASSEKIVAVGDDGITVGASGVSVDLASNSGLSFAAAGLLVSPASASAKAALAANDKILIGDSAAGGTKNSTITVLKNYMQDNITQTVDGYTNGSDNRIITSTNASAINAEANFTFNGGTLSLTGDMSSSLGITASYFAGDGSRLSGLPTAAVTSYTNAADNRVITSVDSSTVNSEANLTFDGSTLTVTGNLSGSGNISGSYFFGDASNLTNVGAGDSAEIAIYGANGTLASDGAFVINSGGGAETAYLTASNLAVSYDAHLNGGTYQKYIIKTVDYTLNTHDHIVYLSGAALTASLPAAVTVNSIIYHIKNIHGDVTALIEPDGSETIEGIPTKVLGPADSTKIQSINNDRWVILGD